MKRVYLLIIALLSVFVTVNVNAYSYGDVQDVIETDEGINFYRDEEGVYSAYFPNEYSETHLKIDFDNDITVNGSKSFVLNDDVTIHNISLTINTGEEGMTVSKIMTFKVIRQNNESYSLALDDLQVVGYDLKYNKDKTNYVVNVPSSLKKVYVYAKPVGNSTHINGDGLVTLDTKSTNVILTVVNPSLGDSEYTITIVKKNYLLRTIVITSLVFLVVIAVILYLFKKYKDKVSSVDINVLKKGVNDLDVSSIISSDANRGLNDIANENIKKGVVEAPTPEENK